jgi:hypothetical protein
VFLKSPCYDCLQGLSQRNHNGPGWLSNLSAPTSEKDKTKVWLIQTGAGTDLLHLLEGNWLPTAIGLACLVVLIWLVVRLITRVNEDADPAAIDREMLTAINELHREGDLTPDEYRSIKGQLVQRLRQPDEVSAAPDTKAVLADNSGGENTTVVKSEESVAPVQPAPSDKTTESENIRQRSADNESRDNDQQLS